MSLAQLDVRLVAGLDRVLASLAGNHRTARWLIPLLRCYIRYAPFSAGKHSLWTHVVNPYLAWREHAFTASTCFGAEMAGTTRKLLEQYIYYFGVWEPHFTHWLRQRLHCGDTFIDVGANVGYYSLLASKLVGAKGVVVAIEASPATFSRLKKNLERNRARNVRAINMAVSDTRGLVRLFHGPETDDGVTTIIEQEGFIHECRFECDVETAPLPSLLRHEEIASARLIKIDVEGAEWLVLSGMKSMLYSGRQDLEIMVEVSPERLARQGHSADDLVHEFRQAGFHGYQVRNDYSGEAYLAAEPTQPVRIHGRLECETDVLFSRLDRAHL